MENYQSAKLLKYSQIRELILLTNFIQSFKSRTLLDDIFYSREHLFTLCKVVKYNCKLFMGHFVVATKNTTSIVKLKQSTYQINKQMIQFKKKVNANLM